MTNLRELAKAAKAAKLPEREPRFADPLFHAYANTVEAFRDAATPDAILALLDSHETALASERQRGDALAREVERLRGALEPFAGYLDTARYDLDNKGNPLPDDEGMGRVYLTVGDFRRARATLTSEAGHGG